MRLTLNPLVLLMELGLGISSMLNPDVKVPCLKTISKYLYKVYEEEKADLIFTITGLDVAFTSDLWTCVAVQCYITVTGHFISHYQRLEFSLTGSVH